MRWFSAVIVLVAAGCTAGHAAPTPPAPQPRAPAPPAPQQPEFPPAPPAAATAAVTAAATADEGIGLEPSCFPLAMFGRLEASPRTPAFDGAARAFDQAAKSYVEGRYLAAGRGFMAAATSFLAAGDDKDRRWSYENAAHAFAAAGALAEARTALLRAVDHDPELAADIRRLLRELETDVCVGRYMKQE